ncbi:hypothetical protein Taro_055207 [Colocasia esculenta]|uniref:Uncharacterized protein n=1 Tax=Colocasia esculenta TaxID=4460 RepID=A0A843XQU7_COLES|nr:hypothetical protein [Colocasia esculenta]
MKIPFNLRCSTPMASEFKRQGGGRLLSIDGKRYCRLYPVDGNRCCRQPVRVSAQCVSKRFCGAMYLLILSGVLTPVVLLEHRAFEASLPAIVVAMRFASEPSLDPLGSFIDYSGWIISKVLVDVYCLNLAAVDVDAEGGGCYWRHGG